MSDIDWESIPLPDEFGEIEARQRIDAGFPELPVLTLGHPEAGFVVELYHRDDEEGHPRWMGVDAVGEQGQMTFLAEFREMMGWLAERSTIATAALLTETFHRRFDDDDTTESEE